MTKATHKLDRRRVLETIRIATSDIERSKQARPGRAVENNSPIRHNIKVVRGITGQTLDQAIQRLADHLADVTGEDIDLKQLTSIVNGLLARGELRFGGKHSLLSVNRGKTGPKSDRTKMRRAQLRRLEGASSRHPLGEVKPYLRKAWAPEFAGMTA